MSKKDTFKPLSLTQHFQPPDDFVGRFGWLCGYSADATFLDEAAQRFTGQSSAQRAHGGQIALAIMVDPGNPYISLVDTPGVLHLGMDNVRDKPFALLHAKVALLAFHRVSIEDDWLMRLIVSTGNWTRDTLETNLDLVWTIDVSKGVLLERDSESSIACADFKAAWEMLQWLRNYFDNRLFSKEVSLRSTSGSFFLDRCIDAVISQASTSRPRFFDNRKQSFLHQLPLQVQNVGTASARNYIAMGSGFFETAAVEGAIPSVLERIVSSLQGSQKQTRLLTARPTIDVFVNPLGCQAVAQSTEALAESRYVVRQAGQPSFFGSAVRRSLHAKFIFSANLRDNSDVCNSAWVYLGSGNLTTPGFVAPMSSAVGNLEAGVVFSVESLFWRNKRGLAPERLLSNVLPIQWDEDIDDLGQPLSARSDMPEREVGYVAAPIPYLTWLPGEDCGWLQPPAMCADTFDVLDDGGTVLPCDDSGRRRWLGVRPRLVQVSWLDSGEVMRAYVPVQDEFGRLAATVLSKMDLDEAWWQLANFPLPPDDEELADADNQSGAAQSYRQDGTSESSPAAYPVRQMMQLIENIAAKQTDISRSDWSLWCARLEECLVRAADSPVLKSFSELGINPVAPLWKPPFRPAYAETADSPEGKSYECMLARIEQEWNVVGFDDLEKTDEAGVSRLAVSCRETESVR